MFLQRLKGKDVRSSPAGTAALYSRRMKMDSTEFAADEKSELRSFMLLVTEFSMPIRTIFGQILKMFNHAPGGPLEFWGREWQ
jgi:hypothetical protein